MKKSEAGYAAEALRCRIWRKANLEAARKIGREASLRHKFGLSQVQYDALVAKQSGLCDICQKAETKILRGKIASLAVDHDHATGKVRALLCNKCNVALGLLREDVQIMQRMIRYVRRHNSPARAASRAILDLVGKVATTQKQHKEKHNHGSSNEDLYEAPGVH